MNRVFRYRGALMAAGAVSLCIQCAAGIPRPVVVEGGPPAPVPDQDADTLSMVTLIPPSGKTAGYVDLESDNVMVLSYEDGTEAAYALTDGSETKPGPDEFDQRLAEVELLAGRLEAIHGIEDLDISTVDAQGDYVVVARIRDDGKRAEVLTFRRGDLSSLGEVAYPMPEPSMYDDEPEVTVELSDNGRWILFTAGQEMFNRDVMLIVRSTMEIKRTYTFQNLASPYWGLDDRRLLIHNGCFCEGEDGRTFEIYDLEEDRPVFLLDYAARGMRLEPCQGLRWKDDFFWIEENHEIHFWDLENYAELDPVPIEPPVNFGDLSITANHRFEREDFKFYPFAIFVETRSLVLVARSDDKGVKIVRHHSDVTQKIFEIDLPLILWMGFVEKPDRLVVVTTDGAVYTIAIHRVI